MSAMRNFWVVLAAVAASSLSGCATTTVGQPEGALVARNLPRGGALSRAVDTTVAVAVLPRESFGNPVMVREGIPIPEPAVPARSGPTPQVPIPMGLHSGAGLYR